MPHPTQISVKQLSKLIGTPNCPLIIDVSIDEDFDADPFLIPSAIRIAHTDIAAYAPPPKTTRIVCICQKGLKLSEGAAAILRAKGYKCENLEGGNFAWRDANLVRLRTDKIPDITKGGTVWVTRQRPKIDRIACPWLIKRFIDPQADFLFTAPSAVTAVAEKFNAIPFDVEGVHWSHEGSLCSFDKFINDLGLDNEPLKTMAAIIRGADTDSHEISQQSAGLAAISFGLSRLFPNDLEQLENGLRIYDALYLWARDGMTETHDWNALSKGRKNDV